MENPLRRLIHAWTAGTEIVFMLTSVMEIQQPSFWEYNAFSRKYTVMAAIQSKNLRMHARPFTGTKFCFV